MKVSERKRNRTINMPTRVLMRTFKARGRDEVQTVVQKRKGKGKSWYPTLQAVTHRNSLVFFLKEVTGPRRRKFRVAREGRAEA
jgi:hypothetical protein